MAQLKTLTRNIGRVTERLGAWQRHEAAVEQEIAAVRAECPGVRRVTVVLDGPNFAAEVTVAVANLLGTLRWMQENDRVRDHEAYANAVAAWQFIGKRAKTLGRDNLARLVEQAITLTQTV